ncbi:MAG: hemerythrin domain-containing protein [Gammaproteobacteria bacterium]|nr:hemerythrin domain-containing protein [Gammaproteobacteria bacterium]
MDIYEYLKMDHKKVTKLFKLFESAPTERNQLEIYKMIRNELTIHAKSEEATFYKALEKHAESLPDTRHGEKEHVGIMNKLAEIDMHKQISNTMKKLILELKQLVEHHVSEEEGKLFKDAKKVLTDKEAYILKLQMHDYKEKLLNGTLSPSTETV